MPPGFIEAHRKLIADTSVQFDLPGLALPGLPPWLQPLVSFLRWLSPAFPVFFWGTVIAVGLTILYLIVTTVRGQSWAWPWQRKTVAAGQAEWRPAPDAARALLAEAEALAAQGRYAEAARLLLRRSVDDIAQHVPEFLKPSLTARDIAGAEALPQAARPAFACIAHAVEVSAFGRRDVTADAWNKCREAYGQFALSGLGPIATEGTGG